MYYKSLLPWVGGKGKLLPVIHALAPEGYDCFLDVFGGSGTVVLNHPRKKGCIEIYNDFNADLTNLFVCVRDRVIMLLKELKRLPLHSRIEYDLLQMFLKGEDFTKKYLPSELATIDECFPPLQAEELRILLIERAEMYDVRRAAIYYRSVRESFSGTGRSFGAKPCNIESFFPLILSISQRIQEMIIENKDFADLFDLHGGEGTWAYCDPPYVNTEDMYPVDFGIPDHYRLHEVALNAKGYVMISYNDCPFIRDLYKEFFIFRVIRPNSMSQKQGSEFAELIITNYDPRLFNTQLSLFASQKNEIGYELIHEPAVALIH